jgi:hypothetical protein
MPAPVSTNALNISAAIEDEILPIGPKDLIDKQFE